VSQEILDIHPLCFQVWLLNGNLDDPTFNEIMKGDPSELKFWYNAIDDELKALYDKELKQKGIR